MYEKIYLDSCESQDATLLKGYDFSIVVLTHNCQDVIVKNLKSILNQDFRNCGYELIIIDDGSHDSTSQILQDFCSGLANVRLICLEKNHGNGYCKNLAIKTAEGEIVFFIDDHVYLPHKNILYQMFIALNGDNKIIGVCGNYISPDLTDYNIFRDIRRFTVYNKNGRDVLLGANNFIPFSIVISAIKKEAFQKTNNFPEHFFKNAAEDTFFQIKQHQKGKEFMYLSNIKVFHSHNLKLGGLVIKNRRELMGFINILDYFSGDSYFRRIFLPCFLSSPLFFYLFFLLSFFYQPAIFSAFLFFAIEVLLICPVFKFKIALKLRLFTFFYCLFDEIIAKPIFVIYLMVKKPHRISSLLTQLFFWEINKLKYLYEIKLKKSCPYQAITFEQRG